jgi:hypothetical protein
MVVREFYETRYDGVNLYRTRSDIGMQIRKVGTDEIYDEAIDVADAPFTYEETNISINTEETYEHRNT